MKKLIRGARLKPKTEKIKIKYHTNVDNLIKRPNGDWIDLRCANEIYLRKGDYCEIPLGISVQLPKGYEMIIKPRSSSFKRWGIIMVCSGIIDESYCGDNDEIKLGVYATKDAHIKFNQRIAQFRIFSHMPVVEFETVDKLDNPNRGGFGSSGTE